MFGEEHPDISYLKEEDIGVVLAKGLAEIYKSRPRDPVDHLAKWLLHYSAKVEQNDQQVEKKKNVEVRKEDNRRYHLQLESDAKEQKEVADKKDNIIKSFNDKVKASDDLTDLLQDLAEHVHEHTNSTGVYIGQLVTPNKRISDGDDERGHENPEAEKEIKYLVATRRHEYIVNQYLKNTEGVTHDVFKENPKPEGEDGLPEGEADAEGEDVKLKEVNEEEILPKSIFIEEVVREPRIKFFEVPKLGSYMAIAMTFNSCLKENALDEAVSDYIDCKQRREHQEKEKKDWEEEQDREKEEKEKEGAEYVAPEDKEWELIKEKPYLSEPLKFVVCIDTMGQDRVMNDEERAYAINKVKEYRDQWEQLEITNLTADIHKRIQIQDKDKEPLEEGVKTLQEEEDKAVEEFMVGKEEITDDDAKEREKNKGRLEFYLKLISNDPVKTELLDFWAFKVVKFRRVLQSAFYMVGHEREDICEVETNQLKWKIAKNFFKTDLFKKFLDYTPLGPKTGSYKKYQLINFIEKNINGIEEDQIESYSVVMMKLFKWLKMLIKVRKEDIMQRRAVKKAQRAARQEAINQDEVRTQNRQNALTEEKTKWEAEHPAPEEKPEGEEQPEIDPASIFNEPEFLKKWDEENPAIVIPAEVIDDIDNDFEIVEEGADGE